MKRPASSTMLQGNGSVSDVSPTEPGIAKRKLPGGCGKLCIPIHAQLGLTEEGISVNVQSR